MTCILSILEPYYGIGIIFAVFLPVYSGSEITFLSPSWADNRREQLLSQLQRHEIVFLQSSVIDGIVQSNLDELPDVNLAAIQSLVICYQSRVCTFQLTGFKEAMAALGLVPDKISTIVTSSVVPVISLPSKGSESLVRYLDRRSLRNDKIQFTSKGIFKF